MRPLAYAARYGGSRRGRRCRRDEDAPEESESDLKQLLMKILGLLLDGGAAVNARDEYNLSALHHATIRGNTETLGFLLGAQGVEKEPRDELGSTPLHLASTYDRLESVILLLQENADPNSLDSLQRTPLHKACQEGNEYIIKALIQKCESLFSTQFFKRWVNMKDKEGNTPLWFATSSGCSPATELLLEHGANPNIKNKNSVYALHCAALMGSINAVKLLVQHGADVNAVNIRNQTPLYAAAQNDHVDVIHYLLDNQADPFVQDSRGLTALHAACKEGKMEAVESLLDIKDSTLALDFDDRSILFIAAQYNRMDVIKTILKREGCKFLVHVYDVYENLPLHIAAKEGHANAVRLLIDAESPIDSNNEDEQTPIHLAAIHGRFNVVETLLKSDNYAINYVDEDSNTALHLACENKWFLVSKKLLDSGAEIECQNLNKWTPLDCAAASGATKCAALLLNNGAQVDPLDRTNTTPLHLAAKFGHEKMVRLLLSRGASLKQEDADGHNALEIALLGKKRSVVKALIESENWKDAFRTSLTITSRLKRNLVPETPLRLLIKTYPELVETVLDACITTSEDPDDPSSQTGVMNFEFLDDTYLWKRITKKKESAATREIQFQYCEVDPTSGPKPFKRPYHSNGRDVNENHPLWIMARGKNRDLLRHPLCLSLVRHKWQNFGRYVFYGRVFVYSLFLVFLTSYLILTAQDSACFKKETSSVQRINDNSINFKLISLIGVICGVVLNIFAELTDIIRSGLRYFNLDNFIDWIVCGLSLFVISKDPIFGSSLEECSTWDASAVLIALAWLNILVYVRQLPYLGIYVIMFFDISLTFIKFGLMFLIFVIAFGLGFHFLHNNQAPFEKIGDSFLKTTVMMIGEFDYGDLYFPESETDLLPGSISKIYFATFVVVMSLIVMNLLVGLAVDDIKAVQDQAELERLQMQVELVLEVERFLPSLLRRLLSITWNEINAKAKTEGRQWQLSDIMSSSNIVRKVFKNKEEPVVTELLTRQQLTDDKIKRIEMELKNISSTTNEMVQILRTAADGNDDFHSDIEYD